MPRFVILLHEMPAGCSRPTHFDLMLEHGKMLRTWALPRLPAIDEPVVAERLADHRPTYLDYEGAVGGERGSVSRVDAGDYDTVEESAAAVRIRVRGGKLQGVLSLIQDENLPHRWRVSLSFD